MRQFLKRLLLPFAIAVVGQVFLVHAEGIRLLGPTGQVQSSPQYSEAVRSSAAQSNNEPSKFYGPTSATETLWSIASKLRPSNQVTVQQTLLALYQLNPESFEQQNIHSLMPGSRLRIPSLAQIRSVTTEEATRVMQAHQQRLDQASRLAATASSSAARARPVKPPEPASVKADTPPAAQPDTKPAQQTGTQQVSPATEKIIPSEQPAQTEAPQSVLSFSSSDATGTGSEILALEEKNHRLTLMLSKVQSEVSDLKNELGDENKVRTEVEKLLAEERRKRAEAERMAPTSLDKLLSNWWTVGALALIPGLLIALLVMWLVGRRRKSDTTADASTEMKDVSDKPISIGDAAEGSDQDDELDDLSLDDDLFSTTNLEVEENEAQDEADVDDVFAELDDVDLDLDLGDESEEDLFASIDDDGDLVDTDLDSDFSASANGISVNSEDKAVGLEEMERALEDASLGADDEEQDEDFDLSSDDQVGMSQDEIETLLDGDALEDDLDTELDQSMLDDLLAEEQDDEFDLGDVGVASDSDLEALFDSIEQQADLEQLEANSQDDSFLDEAFDTGAFDTLDTSEDESENVTDETTALLDELLDESDGTDDELNWDKELEDLGGSDLDDESDDDPFDFDTLELDEDLEADTELGEADTTPIDDGTELFDELLEIEQHGIEEDDDFNREGFIDDLISSAPDKDPLLDAVDFEASVSAEAPEEDSNDFDFNPEIEGSEQVDEDDSVAANEFGVPQDTDWDIEEEQEPSSALTSDDEEVTESEFPDLDETAALSESDTSPADTEGSVLSDSEMTSEIDSDIDSDIDQPSEMPESSADVPVIEADDVAEAGIETEQDIEPEATQAEATVEQPESDDLSDFIDDDVFPELDETAVLSEFDTSPADTEDSGLSDSEMTSEIDSDIDSDIDQPSEMPESSADVPVIEADDVAEAGIETEQDIEPEATQAEATAEQPESDDLSDFIDDDVFPELDETAALSESDTSPADTEDSGLSDSAMTSDIDSDIDQPSEMPESSADAPVIEADDVAEAGIETEQDIEPEATQAEATAEQPESDDLSDFIDDDVFPELDETAVLSEFDTSPADTEDSGLSDSAMTSEIDSDIDSNIDLPSEMPESSADVPVIEADDVAEADIETEQDIEPEATQAEATVEQPESDDLSDFIDDDVFPELDETALLSESDTSPADTEGSVLSDSEMTSEIDSDIDSDIDQPSEMPESSADVPVIEADDVAEAGIETEQEIEPEATQAEAAVEQPESDDLSDFIDDDALPEFDETAALGESDTSPADANELVSEQPESDDLSDFIDDDALPEFDETAALGESDTSPADANELVSEQPESDDLSEFIDDDALPEFDETAALDESDTSPADADELVSKQPESDDLSEFIDDDALPEFDETAALGEFDISPTDADELVSEQPESDDLSEFIDDDALPEFDETAALDESDTSPADADELVSEQPESDDLSEFIDDDALPEFDETAALDESDTSPADADELVSEQPESDDLSEFIDDDALPEFDETAALGESDTSPADADELVSEQPESDDLSEFIDDDALPEFDETAALGESDTSPTDADELLSEQPESDDLSEFIDDDALPEFDETAALDESDTSPADADASEMASDVAPETDLTTESSDFVDEEAGLKSFPKASLDEDALGALLDENAEPEQYVFEPSLDADRIASAGMDFESMLSMGGEDWNGFKLSPEQQASIPDEVPEEELDVWRSENQTYEPQADSEDWEVQDDLFYNESGQPRHLTIDELMSQVEGNAHPFEDVDLKLDVGLNEFPDVIGDITNVDVDSNAEAAGKLDLAKIYIEMNDEAGAVKLLEEAIVDGNDDIRQAAKRLIDELSRRS
ncbi:FimV/HubP family polar landmark protein [Vibrio spartinae]|uniref:Arsenate reductase n=1 Tax=Vibrio spartinae TaxID=1918945 RepID=A0ABX6QWY1_9VIBR|nr:FimV/HubP family polar landmark protein [Vibrio spartinae]QMV13756.1 arsenate reductase [Vibrio spartinae]